MKKKNVYVDVTEIAQITSSTCNWYAEVIRPEGDKEYWPIVSWALLNFKREDGTNYLVEVSGLVHIDGTTLRSVYDCFAEWGASDDPGADKWKFVRYLPENELPDQEKEFRGLPMVK